jgi:hypothetical protein
MRRLVRFHPAGWLALLLLAPACLLAAEPPTGNEAGHGTDAAPSRFRLAASSTEAAPQSSGRYSLRARFAPAESAGELREGGHFTLIGRLAKGNVSCSAGGTIFANGFEGN